MKVALTQGIWPSHLYVVSSARSSEAIGALVSVTTTLILKQAKM